MSRAVESVVVERHAGPLFRVGLAEMNGWRPSMEDAHVVVMRENWGFFGVFDGHGGSQCSAFVAKRITDHMLANDKPKDDATVKALMLDIDREFLASGQPSGSTGTFVIVETPKPTAHQGEPEGEPAVAAENGKESRHLLRVGNIGDSRVLLGRFDGTIVEGPGTDGGLTTDHKPDHPSEVERINRNGGTVQNVQGVARVNGDLAVSRAFGDAQHKETGGPAQEDHPVSAEPEFTTVTAGQSDFVVLVCDGISEQNFPNREVIELAAESLRRELDDGKAPDLGAVATAVCRRAFERGSTDNLSCMILLLSGGEVAGPHHEFFPAAFSAPEQEMFRRAYAAMAERAGLTLAQAVEMRYDHLRRERVQALTRSTGRELHTQPSSPDNGEPYPEAQPGELREELSHFGEGPPDGTVRGSPERIAWFQAWLDKHEVQENQQPSRQELLMTLTRNPAALKAARDRGVISPNELRLVEVPSVDILKPAVEAHRALRWDERLQELCGQRGRVMLDDNSDGTSQVAMMEPKVTAWLPTDVLINREHRRKVQVISSDEQLQIAVEAHVALRWRGEMAKLVGQTGEVLREDSSDGTTEVAFEMGQAWLPNAALIDLEEETHEVRKVVINAAPHDLHHAIENHPVLKWDRRYSEIVGKIGVVKKSDDNDGTSQVWFRDAGQGGMNVWVPTNMLDDVSPSDEPLPHGSPTEEELALHAEADAALAPDPSPEEPAAKAAAAAAAAGGAAASPRVVLKPASLVAEAEMGADGKEARDRGEETAEELEPEAKRTKLGD